MIVLAVASCAVAAALWLLRTEAGAAWSLARAPGLQASGVRGSLLGGDLDVQRLTISLPRGGLLTIEGASWRGLRISFDGSWRPHVVIERLAADAVDLKPGTPASTPSPAPESLALPFELQVKSVEVQTLRAVPLGATPLRELRARIHLGAEGGSLHRLDGLSLGFDRLRAQGSATLGSAAPLPLQATLSLAQDGTPAELQWSAQASLAGSMAAPALIATVRAQPTVAPGGKPLPAQSLDLSAALRPFEAWPLGDLDAKAKGLDLSAFHPAAPVTAISGSAVAKTRSASEPAQVTARLDNAAPGRWNEGRLPAQSLGIELRARPDDPTRLEVRTFEAELGTPREPAGRLQGQGHWSREGWRLEATLKALQPQRLDARAPAMLLDGPLTLDGSAPAAAVQTLAARGELNGKVLDRGTARAVRLRLDGDWRREAGADRITLRDAQAEAGGARASVKASASRAAPGTAWQLKGQATLAAFDPAVWWPGREDSPWRRGPHRLNANSEFDLTLPPAGPGRALDRLATLRGQATAVLTDSVLAGVPLRGQLSLRGAAAGALQATAQAELDGNRLDAEGRIGLAAGGADDRWQLTLQAPTLAKLAPLARLAGADTAGKPLGGALTAELQASGRWPAISSTGKAQATELQAGSLALKSGSARWQAGTTLDAPVDAEFDLAGLVLGAARFENAELRAQGSGRAHRLELSASSNARPPGWTEALPTAPTSIDTKNGTLASLQMQGGFVAGSAGAIDGWRGTLQQLEARPAGGTAATAAWLRTRDVAVQVLGLDAGPQQLLLQAGRAELFGAALRWDRLAWQAAQGGTPARIDAKAEMEPLTIAPLLARLQPDFGWGGDLAVTGRLELRSAPTFAADIVVERSRGDLSVTDETGTQALGLTDLRLGLNVADGVWSFTQGLAGSTVGVAAGAFVARTSPQSTWPSPDTPVSGVLELQVANLGTWGTWVPAGWRIGGALSASAGIGGKFGAPEYTGAVRGTRLSVRNFLQGVNVTDGEVAIVLQGATARIERFTARGGAGTLELGGDASFGASPLARLQLEAKRFQLLGRVDRRIVVSGNSTLQIERDKFTLGGRLAVDEGLIDFTRSDAPGLSDDVTVSRRPARAADPQMAEPKPAASNARAPTIDMDVRLDLGEQLRVKGRGLDTGLRGELRLTAPGGRLAVNGTVRTAGGTYAAYGQKLEIDRGNLVFNGAAENPRLDIEATRPNLDVRVGVAITGTAVNPRVRLFSEPELSDLDKLSWLVLGRASDGLGRTDTALLQRAALALLTGDGEGPTDQLTRAIGLDEVSVRQSDGEVRETVISLGKQLSRRWYVGYERSLNATAGSWQLIYRIAQRFTLRAQSGEDSSLDVIWTWRWN
ncbi:translocation/assembly module TamB domain-containing protein [Rhizobacter sp. AJA081-3]|nr:translocation/assembly module TamB domain-containing protein [Rhizobacter sp. AJA081-3]